MRLLAFVLLGLFAFAFLAGAAEIDDVSRDALQPGRSALQFEIDDGFFVSGFEGTTLSYKRMISERSAWRFGVTYGGSTFDGEEFRQDVVDTSLVPDSDAETSSSAFGFGLSAMYMRYVGGRGRVRPFLGAGPFGGYNHSEEREEGQYYSPFVVSRLVEGESSSWEFGARAMLGAEVFVSRGISLLGQYSTEVSHVSFDDSFSIVDTAPQIPPDEVRGSHSERSRDGWRFGDNQVSLGLSAYF